MTILYIILALVAGAGATYLLFQGKLALLQSQLAQASQDQAKQATLEAENRTLFGKLSQVEGQNETLKMTVENQKSDEEKLRKMLVEISNESVLRQGKMLSDQQQVKLNDVLNPLKEKLKEFEEKVNLGQKSSLEQSTVLMEQIKNLTSLNQTVTQKTEDLTNALKGSNKSQGNWGEMILERVLESSGLKNGMEYQTQFVTKNQDQDTIKPDAVIFLPDKKNLIIDSKVSLVASYLGFLIGTLFCAYAPGFGLLLAARAITGAFAGLLRVKDGGAWYIQVRFIKCHGSNFLRTNTNAWGCPPAVCAATLRLLQCAE